MRSSLWCAVWVAFAAASLACNGVLSLDDDVRDPNAFGSAGAVGAGTSGSGGGSGRSGSSSVGGAGAGGASGANANAGSAGFSGSNAIGGESGTAGAAGVGGVAGGASAAQGGQSAGSGGVAGMGGAAGLGGAASSGSAGASGASGEAGTSGASGSAGAAGAGGQGGTSACGTLTQCTSGCVDIDSDPLNCGGCDALCATPLSCTFGVCGRALPVNTGDSYLICMRRHLELVCWGTTSNRQIGAVDATNNLFPETTFAGAPSIGILSISATFTCSVSPAGDTSCWGRSTQGQLGNGVVSGTYYQGWFNNPDPVPVSLPAGSKAIALASGGWWLPQGHVCAALDDGRVFCWGANDVGQLGAGPASTNSCQCSLSPLQTDLLGSSPATSVASAHDASCALFQDGTVQCWGKNSGGALGIGVSDDNYIGSPTVVSGAGNAVSLFAGGNVFCTIDDMHVVRCWGQNDFGQINGTFASVRTPVVVTALPDDVTEIAAGYNHTCARTLSGDVYCWGANEAGELGNGGVASGTQTTSLGTYPCDPTPQKVGIGDVIELSSTDGNLFARKADGTLWAWGAGKYGELGTLQQDALVPQIVPHFPTY